MLSEETYVNDCVTAGVSRCSYATAKNYAMFQRKVCVREDALERSRTRDYCKRNNTRSCVPRSNHFNVGLFAYTTRIYKSSADLNLSVLSYE